MSDQLEQNAMSVNEATKIFEEAFQTKTEASLSKIEAALTAPEDTKEVTKPDNNKTVVADKTEHAISDDTTKEAVSEETDPDNKEKDGKPEDQYAWIKELSDETLRSKVTELLEAKNFSDHRFNSENGRVIASNKRVMDLTRELQKLKASTTAQTQPQDSVDKKTAAKIEIPTPDSPEWAKIAEVDPEFAKAVRDQMTKMAESLNDQFEKRVKAAIDPIKQHQSEQVNDQQYDIMMREAELLQRAVPNYRDVISSDEFEYWKQNVATPAWRNLADNSGDHRTAIDVLRKFQEDGMRERFGRFAEIKESGNTPNAQPKTATQEDTSKADRIAKERKETLEKAALVKGSSTTPQVKAADDKGPVTRDAAAQLFASIYEGLK